MMRAGERVRTLASRLFQTKTMERVVDPIVADMQCEHAEAVAAGARGRAVLIVLRSYVGLGWALISLGLRAACDVCVGAPHSDLARSWVASLVAFTLLTATLILPPLVAFPSWTSDPLYSARLSVTLVPQALPLSIPAGLCFGVLWAARGQVAGWPRIGQVLVTAVALTTVVWAVLEWMIPGANQGFRELVAARLAGDGRELIIEPGMNELSLSRLGQRSEPAAILLYHQRLALCLAALPLSLLALGLARFVRRRASALALPAGLLLSYIGCVWMLAALPSSAPPSPMLRAWLPNVACFAAACALLRPRRATDGTT